MDPEEWASQVMLRRQQRHSSSLPATVDDVTPAPDSAINDLRAPVDIKRVDRSTSAIGIRKTPSAYTGPDFDDTAIHSAAFRAFDAAEGRSQQVAAQGPGGGDGLLERRIGVHHGQTEAAMYAYEKYVRQDVTPPLAGDQAVVEGRL